MSNLMLIDGGVLETRVAVVEEGRLAEVHIERAAELPLVGNIYKGRVSRVVPGIQATFVDLGLARDAFLVAPNLADSANGSDRSGKGEALDASPLCPEGVLEPGRELLVQVVKQPQFGKGVRISTQITLPGRFLVLLPGATNVGVSRRISDAAERARLEETLLALRPGEVGLIARTVAATRSREELDREAQRLVHRWQEVRELAAASTAPALVHEELDLPRRAVRDLLDDRCDEVWVAGEAIHARIVRYLRDTDRVMAGRIRLHEGSELLFDRFAIETAISKAMRSKVWLESGGFIVISPTEALVAIDVNTGRYTGSGELENTVFRTNLEAAVEAARQIRLRDLSGIIVVDFIDMAESDHRAQVLAALADELAKDRTRIQLTGISEFGLVEVTRKRVHGGLLERVTRPCPSCSGKGRVKDTAAVIAELGRTLLRRRLGRTSRPLRVRVHPTLAAALEGPQRGLVEELESRLDVAIRLQQDASLRPDDYDILAD